MVEVKYKPMKSFKPGKKATFYNFKYGKYVKGVVNEALDGYYFNFERLYYDESENKELQVEKVNLHLTAEDKLDKEDLENINEIMDLENLGFISWN